MLWIAATLVRFSDTAMAPVVGGGSVATRPGVSARAAAAAACESATDAGKRRAPVSHSCGVPATVATFAGSVGESERAGGAAAPATGAQSARDRRMPAEGLFVALPRASRSAGPRYVVPSSGGPHHGSCSISTMICGAVAEAEGDRDSVGSAVVVAVAEPAALVVGNDARGVDESNALAVAASVRAADAVASADALACAEGTAVPLPLADAVDVDSGGTVARAAAVPAPTGVLVARGLVPTVAVAVIVLVAVAVALAVAQRDATGLREADADAVCEEDAEADRVEDGIAEPRADADADGVADGVADADVDDESLASGDAERGALTVSEAVLEGNDGSAVPERTADAVAVELGTALALKTGVAVAAAAVAVASLEPLDEAVGDLALSALTLPLNEPLGDAHALEEPTSESVAELEGD